MPTAAPGEAFRPVAIAVGPGPFGDDLLEQLLEPVGVQAQHRRVDVDQALGLHVVGHDPLGEGGPLADPGLEQPQLALLDGELDVAHVAVVAPQGPHVLLELLPGPRLDVAHLLQLHGVADPGHDVLALGVDQVVAVGPGVAVGRVAGEGDPGARVLTLVAEHHGLDVDRGAERVVDLVLAPVVDRPLVVPGAEHGLDAALELLGGVLGELATGLGGDDGLELLDQPPQVARVQLHVVADALGLLGVLQRLLEAVALHPHDRLAVHLQQPPVGVPREPLRPGLAGQALDALVVQAQVQHRVHHPRHRERGAGADRDQQRVVRVAEAAAHPLLELLQVLGDLLQHAVGELPPRRPVGVAGLAGHREPDAGRAAPCWSSRRGWPPSRRAGSSCPCCPLGSRTRTCRPWRRSLLGWVATA